MSAKRCRIRNVHCRVYLHKEGWRLRGLKNYPYESKNPKSKRGVSVVVVCVIVVTAGCVQCTVQCTVQRTVQGVQLGSCSWAAPIRYLGWLRPAPSQSSIWYHIQWHSTIIAPPTLSTQSYISLKNAFRWWADVGASNIYRGDHTLRPTFSAAWRKITRSAK